MPSIRIGTQKERGTMIKDLKDYSAAIEAMNIRLGLKGHRISEPTETTDSSDTTNFVVQFIPRKPKPKKEVTE